MNRILKKATDEPLVSIIVPVFNAEKYLEHCIQSLIHQTYKNIEIILINGGSYDNSQIICATYRDYDSRIVLKCQENQGVSSARNAGLQSASGEYVLFCDSDDYIENTMVEEMVEAILLTKSVVCICGILYEENETGRFPIVPQSRVISCQELYNELLSGETVKNFMCGKMYDSRILNNNIFNEEIKSYEDIDFQLRLFSNASSSDHCVIMPSYLYHYNKHCENSLSHNAKNILSSCEYLLRKVVPKLRKAENTDIRKYKLLIYETDALKSIGKITVSTGYLFLRNQVFAFLLASHSFHKEEKGNYRLMVNSIFLFFETVPKFV